MEIMYVQVLEFVKIFLKKIKNIDCSEEGVSEDSTILEPFMPL